jgi:hypothetical protein
VMSKDSMRFENLWIRLHSDGQFGFSFWLVVVGVP